MNWSLSNGFDRQNEYTNKYLERLKNNLKENINSLIKIGIKKMTLQLAKKLTHYTLEVIHHSNIFSNFLVNDTSTQDEVIKKVTKLCFFNS